MVRDDYTATLFLTLWKENRYHSGKNLLMNIKYKFKHKEGEEERRKSGGRVG